MGHFFDQDSGFMRALWWFTDVVLINLYLLITSIPVVTIGAAITAAYDAARRSQEARGGLTRNYFRAFARNFKQATRIWLPFAVVGAGLVYSWLVLRVPALLPFKVVLTLVWLFGFWWVFPLQSRLENSVGKTVKNAYIFSISYLGTTLGIAVIDAFCLVLLWASVRYWIQSVFFLAIMGAGMMIALHVPLIERALKPYTNPSRIGQVNQESQESQTGQK